MGILDGYSPTKKKALKAYDDFLAHYSAKYLRACKCLEKDREQLFNFYDFPAAHSDNESNRIDICNCSTSESANQGMWESNSDFDNGLQVGKNGPKWMATVERIKNALKNRCWSEI